MDLTRKTLRTQSFAMRCCRRMVGITRKARKPLHTHISWAMERITIYPSWENETQVVEAVPRITLQWFGHIARNPNSLALVMQCMVDGKRVMKTVAGLNHTRRNGPRWLHVLRLDDRSGQRCHQTTTTTDWLLKLSYLYCRITGIHVSQKCSMCSHMIDWRLCMINYLSGVITLTTQ